MVHLQCFPECIWWSCAWSNVIVKPCWWLIIIMWYMSALWLYSFFFSSLPVTVSGHPRAVWRFPCHFTAATRLQCQIPVTRWTGAQVLLAGGHSVLFGTVQADKQYQCKRTLLSPCLWDSCCMPWLCRSLPFLSHCWLCFFMLVRSSSQYSGSILSENLLMCNLPLIGHFLLRCLSFWLILECNLI